MKKVTHCHCGRPLHYQDKSLEAQLTDLTEQLGEFMPVTVDGKTWSVQRHYIALHGIKGKDLSKLEFKEFTDEGNDGRKGKR
jgi:hypothetical protein